MSPPSHVHPLRSRVATDLRTATIVAVLAASGLTGIVLRHLGLTGGSYSWFAHADASQDSWQPMNLAYARAMLPESGSLYDVFFIDHVKFQYPPSALLLYRAFDALEVSRTLDNLNELVWFSILLTAISVAWLTQRCLFSRRDALRLPARDRAILATSAGLATLCFYPVMVPWHLGQIQALLTLGFVLACLAWTGGRFGLAGCLIGAICLVKPQLGLFAVWGLLVGARPFLFGLLATVLAGSALTVQIFGAGSYPEYLKTLVYLSQHGEAYWANTSINGLLNRIVFPERALRFDLDDFPPYSALVHGGTMLSSIAIVGFVLVRARRSEAAGSLLAFMTAAVAFTVASPVAWEHHFGILMPVFCIATVRALLLPDGRGRIVLLATLAGCYGVLANQWAFDLRGTGGIGHAALLSWRLAAVLGLLVLLERLQRLSRDGAAPQARGPRLFAQAVRSGSEAPPTFAQPV